MKSRALAATEDVCASAEAGLPMPSTSFATSFSSEASPRSLRSDTLPHDAKAGTNVLQQQQQQQSHATPHSSLPKVSISSHKHTASSTPVPSNGSGAAGTSSTSAFISRHNAATAAESTGNTAPKPLETTKAVIDMLDDDMSSTTTRTASSQDVPADHHLAQQLADAPAPAMTADPTAEARSRSSYSNLAPTPASSPSKPSFPRPTATDLANITKAAAMLSKDSGLCAEAVSFEPQCSSGQRFPTPNGHNVPSGSLHSSLPGQCRTSAPTDVLHMAQGFRELPQRKLRPNNRKQQNKQRDAGPSRLSKATFIDMPDSQDDHEPSTKALTADTATQQPMSPANADEAPFPGLMPPRSPNHTVADASADLHGNPAPIAESGLQEIRVNYASPAKIAPDEAPSAPLSMLAEDISSPKSTHSGIISYSVDPNDNLPPGLVTYPYVQPLASVLPGVTNYSYALGLMSSEPTGAHHWPEAHSISNSLYSTSSLDSGADAGSTFSGEVPKTTTPAPLFPSGRQIKTPAAALHINNECAKIWALSDTRLRRLGLTVEPPSTQTIPAYYGGTASVNLSQVRSYTGVHVPGMTSNRVMPGTNRVSSPDMPVSPSTDVSTPNAALVPYQKTAASYARSGQVQAWAAWASSNLYPGPIQQQYIRSQIQPSSQYPSKHEIFIGNLLPSITSVELRRCLPPKGLQHVMVARDRGSGQPKGFGFASFWTKNQAWAAIRQLNGSRVVGNGNRHVRVEPSKYSTLRW
ncbi:hypothetical protein WJX74_005906 [Apatococcus lobatus]|uniref:RRM domain-containing protein n=1 Tax=Apatococcus lobatus TaxID=904363 RepID=A0AAW1R1A6_9CHLO